jgi:hypothetical protein
MGAILLVVADSALPSTGDGVLQNVLADLSHVVTYRSDDVAEDVTGFDGVVISDSCSSATLGTKYDTVSVPVADHEAQHWDDMRLVTAASVAEISTTDVTWLATAHPIEDGPYGTFSGTDTIYSAASLLPRSNSVASGAVLVANSGASQICCGAAETGAVLTSGTAPARRVFMWPRDGPATLLTEDGRNPLKNAYYWLFGLGTPQNVLAWYSA